MTTGAQNIAGSKTFSDPVFVSNCIVHNGDSNTHIKFTDDCIRLTTGSDGQLTVTNTEVIVNEPGNSNDFRVESNTDTHALFVDGSADNVGIGTSSPAAKLTVANSGRINGILRTATTPLTAFYDNDFAANCDGGGADGFIYNSCTGGSLPLDYYGELILQ